MMLATSACPQNGLLPGVGGSREAMADDAPWCRCCKNCEAPVCPKKRTKKGSDVELWQESAYDENGIDLRTGLYVPRLRYPCFG